MVVYNILNSGIEMKYQEQIRTIYPEKIKISKIGDHIILPLRGMEVEGLEKITYFELLSSGKIKLLCKHAYESAMVDGNSLVPQVTGEQSYNTDAVFLLCESRKNQEIAFLPKKRILEVFEDQAAKIEAFLKAKRLRLSKQEDLVLLFDYYNSFVMGK